LARQIPWLRIAAEGVAIIVSILLAFGIQAWWDGRSIGVQVRQDLQNISQETLLNRARVVRAIDVRTRLAAGTSLLAQAIESNVGAPVISLPDTLVWLGTAGPNTPDLPFGAVEALIASGRLAFVEDPELRVRLGRIRNTADDAQEGSGRLMRLYDEYYLPLMWNTPTSLR
jgi:hypothetical protein